MPIFQLLTDDPTFPSPDLANRHGLLAVGGDLSVERLLNAYAMGIFPWFGPDDPILWWSPDPRLVLYPSKLYVSKRLKRKLRQQPFRFTCDTAFGAVIRQCAANRPEGTWIGPEMVRAYEILFEKGYAHSLEVWQEYHLVGGVYGVSMGGIFFGESMFHRVSDASKAALVELCQVLQKRKIGLVDCQVESEHLHTLGAELIPRRQFLTELGHALQKRAKPGLWRVK